MNNVNLIGRTTEQPQIRKTPTGKKYLFLTLAVAGGKDHTNFIRCIAWDETAQRIVDFVKKGNRIAVSGRIEITTKQNEDGTYKTSSLVVIQNLTFLENKLKEAKEEAKEETKEEK